MKTANVFGKQVNTLALAAVAIFAAAGASVSHGQVITYNANQPTFDRWMYPFGYQPGLETQIPIFGAITTPGFDDRDGQCLLSFSTGSTIPAGLGIESYHVQSVRVKIYVAVDQQFVYDPTWDSVRTLYSTTDPEYIPDVDLGKPVELFGVGFRNGWNSLTFGETSKFGGAPIVPPSEGARNNFAAIFDDAGNATDVSRQVRQRFDAQPMSIGQMSTVAPGALVPEGTEITFDVDLCNSTTRHYFERAFDTGVLDLMITSLSPAQGGPDGGVGDPSYPAFFSKENAAGAAAGKLAKIEISVRVGRPADFDGSGFVDFDDFNAFVQAFEAGDPSADFDGSCFVDFDDFNTFVTSFEEG